MANDYLVCIIRNEALVRKVIIVDPDSIVDSLLKRICEEFKIDNNDFDLYFSKPSGMTQLMDSEKMGDIGMSESADARNNFVIIDKPKKRKKQKSVEKPTTESLPKSDIVDCDKPVVCSEFEDMETVTKRTSLTTYSGLQNQGSTCYLNCIIQILFWTPAVRNAVLSWKLLDTDTHPLKCVLIQFQKLCVRLWLSVENSQSTNMLTKCLGIRSVFTQEDAFEKFNWFISCLETRLNTLKIKDNITPLFIGQQESFLTCRECGTKTSKVEDFSGIMLPIKDSVTEENFGSLTRALEAYCTTEVLSDENKCHCMNCGGLKAMEKQLLFKKLPDILNIVLLRFQSVGGINTKLHHRVEYPKSICFKDILSGDQPENWYSLHSAIIHSGSADTGHYLCIVKDTNNRFIRINDQKVEWLTDEDFISSFGRDESGCRISARSAYILTYHRHGSKNLSSKPIQINQVQLDAKDVYESYLGDDFKCYVGYKYSHRMVYHSIYSNMLTTLKEVRELGQKSFPACNGKSMRMRWLNSVNRNSLPIFDENMELNEVIKEAPFKKLHFVLEHEDDDTEDFNMNRNVVIDQPLILNHQTLATKSPLLKFKGENYFDGESLFGNKLYVTVHLLNNENNEVMNSTCAFPRAKLEQIKSALLETPVAIKTANSLNDKIYEINRVLLASQFRAIKNMETIQRNLIEESQNAVEKLDLDNVNDSFHNRLPHLVWWIVQKSQNC